VGPDDWPGYEHPGPVRSMLMTREKWLTNPPLQFYYWFAFPSARNRFDAQYSVHIPHLRSSLFHTVLVALRFLIRTEYGALATYKPFHHELSDLPNEVVRSEKHDARGLNFDTMNFRRS
jgi:hypothetical protein